MPIIKDQAQIEAMRRRLYERGAVSDIQPRHTLSEVIETASPTWPPPLPILTQTPSDPRTAELTTPELEIEKQALPRPRFFSYRMIIVLVTLGLFLLVLGMSSLYLMFGNTQISNKNINLNIAGPLTIGGGEVMPLTIGITNQNKVPIESVVLIVSYPPGTKSSDESPRDLYEERISLDRINAGEAINVPVKATMFGEENQEYEIKATVEYRLVDSSGTFYKEADPLKFKINSSPLVIQVETLEKVSAGQAVDVKLTIKSNASTPLRDILVSANYPGNFDYTSAEPVPDYRESEWIVKELLPEKSTVILIKGIIVGQQAEEFQMKFSAGTAKQDNQFIIGSVLANASTDFVIEQPFIKVGVGINGLQNTVVTLNTGDSTDVEISVQNTLEETLYNMALEVSVKGNILVRESVVVKDGYYDSVKDVIRFEPSGNAELKEVSPGETKTFTFTLKPSDKKETPAFSITANAYARRVQETRVTEQLVGTANSEVKFTSSVVVGRQVSRSVSGFTETGPVPPVADVETTYTVVLTASAGGNDVTGATLVTSLPQYVNWKNLTRGDGVITFNPISKELTWTIGAIDAGAVKTTSFQIGLLPSQNQIGTTPAVLGTQRFRATDRFTSEVVRAENAPASSELSRDSGLEEENGKVLKAAL